MATIMPFRAVHFNKKVFKDITELICPVYDVIDENMYNRYLNKNKYNIIRLEKPDTKKSYIHAKSTLEHWINKKILVQDKQENIYIYEQEFKFKGKLKKLIGIICLVKLEEYESGIILRHEKTLSSPKIDRSNLLEATKCNFSPIFSLYSDKNFSILKKLYPYTKTEPEFEVVDENNVIHRIFKISSKELIEEICNKFKDKQLFIADGHHRYETALNFKKSHPDCKYTMMFLTDMNSKGLVILPTHRIVKALSNFSFEEVLSICKKNFIVIKCTSKYQMKEKLNFFSYTNMCTIGLCLGKSNYYILKLKDNIKLNNTNLATTDTSFLHELIINNLNIKKEQITFSKDMDAAISTAKKEPSSIAFLLNPTPINDIIKSAIHSKIMPQKTTFFYSKVIAGLLINKINN